MARRLPYLARVPRFSLIDDPAQLDAIRAAWDELAVAAGAPFAAPGWSLAWWRHLAPKKSRLAVAAVRDGEELIGLAPFHASRLLGVTELRLLGGGLASRLGVLAKAGAEREVAEAITAGFAAADARPDLIHWEAIDADSQWPERLADGTGRGRQVLEESRRSAPVVDLGANSYEEWFAAKSRNFRSQMRRHRRGIEEAGATFRFASQETLAADLAGFSSLHEGRWEARGGSAAVNEAVMAMLAEVAAELIGSGRIRLSVIEGPDGNPVSSQIFISAGEVIAYWNGGFDESWGDRSPGMLAILAAVEDSFERGETLLDLGGGEARYKDRLADEDRPVAWRTSYPRGARYPLARLRRLPAQVARRGSHTLRQRLGADRLNRLRNLLSR